MVVFVVAAVQMCGICFNDYIFSFFFFYALSFLSHNENEEMRSWLNRRKLMGAKKIVRIKNFFHVGYLNTRMNDQNKKTWRWCIEKKREHKCAKKLRMYDNERHENNLILQLKGKFSK